MFTNDYNKIVTEYFDITDTETRKILMSIDEADQNQVVTSLASKLYDSIVKKIDDIDCSTITQSAGDITKVENYEKLVECLGVMKSLVEAGRSDYTEPITIILEAMNNVKNRKEMFEKAFRLEIELPMIFYNMITLSCVAATSFMISCCVEFVKSPKDKAFSMTVDKVKQFHSSDYLMFKNLERFNKICSNGSFDKAMENIINTNTKNFVGSTGAVVAVGVVASIAIVTLILNIVPIIREIIFTFYLARVKISDYFAVQADLLEMNAANIECNSTIDSEKRKKIAARQTTIASHFRKISNTVEVKLKDANAKAISELNKSNTKLKIKDVVDKMPNSADTTSLF